MVERRFPWYLLTGVLIGLVAGFGINTLRNPQQAQPFVEPSTLRSEFRDEYRALVAAAYVANGDLGRAQSRMQLIGDADPAQALASQAQLALAEGGSAEVVRALGLLAGAYGQQPIEIEQASPVPVEEPSVDPGEESDGDPTPTPVSEESSSEEVAESEPTATPILLPTRTPTAIPAASFEVENFQPVCNSSLDQPLLQVFANDANGQAVPGVEIIVTWEGGEDRFYTGLKPEFGLGYADYTMTPGELYTVQLTTSGEPITGIAAPDCEDGDGGRYWGSWQVTFVEP
ncbi:MAG: hypothetical protein DWQ07_14575 [Chloroflexi bacterium]|nr:MAG: hypothetical protein DWQ07_14575 [Chloroflexota bacterium]MBL1195692.1 hypothetical protein [Chloroflexota bacterium]NOH12980.1 hypothetical protein [Chloroflexota bacterium]